MNLPRPTRRLIKSLILLASILAANSTEAASGTLHQLKSAFIFNFSKYIGFPSEALQEGKPFLVGIEGEDDYGPDLVAALNGKLVDGHAFVVRRVRNLAEMRQCQFMIVGESKDEEIRRVVRAVQGSPVVLIGDGSEFTRDGGTIAFVEVDNRVRFDVNLEAAKASRLTISSKLLGLAVNIYR